MKTVRRLFAFALVLVCLGAICVLPANALDISGLANIFDEDEYAEFIKTEEDLPDDFVSMDQLRGFGRFCSFVCNGPTYSTYGYSLKDLKGEHITICIEHGSWIDYDWDTFLDLSEAGTNMRSLTEVKDGYIYRDGVLYEYNMGRLYSMQWLVNDTVYDISFASNGTDRYENIPEDSVLYRLLSVSEADFQSGLAELEKNIGHPLDLFLTPWQEFLRFVLPYILLIGAGVGLYFIIRRKKKKGEKSSQ